MALAVTLGVLAVWAAIFVRGLIAFRRTLVLRPGGSAGGRAVVFVPARNEASVVGRSVRALLEPSSSAFVSRVIAIDDRSTDGTRAELDAIARGDSRLTILEGRGPGPGECGKPAALVLAYETVKPETEWLLFVDADVVFEPGGIAALFAARADSGADLVSVIPRVHMEHAVEKLVMPSIGALILAQHPPDRVARPDDPIAFANGQVILVRRAIYDAAGGHAAVISEILEDVRLAERVKKQGGRLLVADGRFIASTRMYEGWEELVEGWSKNLYLLLGGRAAVVWRWVIMSVILAWSGVALGVAFGWPIGVAGYLAVLAVQISVRAMGGASPIWAVLAPISAILTAWIALRSMRLHLRGAPIAWKGREYTGR